MTDPAGFPRAFAAAFGAQDAEAFAALFAEDGSFHALTGHWTEGRNRIADAMRQEFAGLSRMARLVTGKTAQRQLGPDTIILHQRFVVTGLRDASGAELSRVGALLTAVLASRNGTWQVLTATFAVIED
jgi:uncharacterized protein (TIGR02246 family)